MFKVRDTVRLERNYLTKRLKKKPGSAYVQIIRGDDHEGIRRARRAYKRAR